MLAKIKEIKPGHIILYPEMFNMCRTSIAQFAPRYTHMVFSLILDLTYITSSWLFVYGGVYYIRQKPSFTKCNSIFISIKEQDKEKKPSVIICITIWIFNLNNRCTSTLFGLIVNLYIKCTSTLLGLIVNLYIKCTSTLLGLIVNLCNKCTSTLFGLIVNLYIKCTSTLLGLIVNFYIKCTSTLLGLKVNLYIKCTSTLLGLIVNLYIKCT